MRDKRVMFVKCDNFLRVDTHVERKSATCIRFKYMVYTEMRYVYDCNMGYDNIRNLYAPDKKSYLLKHKSQGTPVTRIYIHMD